jgi:hypothetical protein
MHCSRRINYIFVRLKKVQYLISSVFDKYSIVQVHCMHPKFCNPSTEESLHAAGRRGLFDWYSLSPSNELVHLCEEVECPLSVEGRGPTRFTCMCENLLSGSVMNMRGHFLGNPGTWHLAV